LLLRSIGSCELNIGRENGKKSKVVWEIKDKDEVCIVKISIFPYRTNKIPVFFYPLVSFFFIRPKVISSIGIKGFEILSL